MKILFAEDEKRMAHALIEILHQEKYDVDWVPDGESAIEAIVSNIYDCIILDVMMPYKNGFDVARDARKKGIKTPILMLTAKSDISDKVVGLDSGADDYLTKPFQTQELLARIRALLRRTGLELDKPIEFGDLSLDKNTNLLICKSNGQSVALSSKEYKIMEYMMLHSESFLNRDQFTLKVWGYDNDSEYNNVEVYMTFLRRKMTFIGSKTEIKATRGMGYQLRYENV